MDEFSAHLTAVLPDETFRAFEIVLAGKSGRPSAVRWSGPAGHMPRARCYACEKDVPMLQLLGYVGLAIIDGETYGRIGRLAGCHACSDARSMPVRRVPLMFDAKGNLRMRFAPLFDDDGIEVLAEIKKGNSTKTVTADRLQTRLMKKPTETTGVLQLCLQPREDR